MRMYESYKNSEDNVTLLKRCISTYKQDFLINEKSFDLDKLTSSSYRELNFSPNLNSYINDEIDKSNVRKEKNFFFDDYKIKEDANIRNPMQIIPHKFNKNKKIGGVFFQENIKKNFSPKIQKKKIDYDLQNIINIHDSTERTSQNPIKDKLSNFVDENKYLLDIQYTKNINTNEVYFLNNSSNQNLPFKKVKSLSPVKIMQNLDSNHNFDKQEENIITESNLCSKNNYTNKYYSYSTNNSNYINLRQSEKSGTKDLNLIQKMEVNDLNKHFDLPGAVPVNQQSGYKKFYLPRNNFSMNYNILRKSTSKQKNDTSKSFGKKKLVNFSKVFINQQIHKDNRCKLFSPIKRSISKNAEINNKHKTSNEVIVNNYPKKIINYNSDLRLKNNRYKINYTAKSYAELKNKEITNDKNHRFNNKNLKICIKNSKKPNLEINTNNFKRFNVASDSNKNSRNFLTSDNVLMQKSLISNLVVTSEDVIENKEIESNLSNPKNTEKNQIELSNIGCIRKKNCYTKSNIIYDKFLNDNKLNSNNAIRNSTNNVYDKIKKHIKTKSQLSYNLNKTKYSNLDPGINVISYKKLSNYNNNIHVKNFQSSSNTDLHKNKKDYKIEWNSFEDDKQINSQFITNKTKSENNLIDLNNLTKEIINNKIEKAINLIADDDKTTIIIDSYNNYDILDSKEYENKVPNSASTFNQILTKTTKDDSMQQSVKHLNQQKSLKNFNIEGPEDLHYFYVNVFQTKKDFAPRFDY